MLVNQGIFHQAFYCRVFLLSRLALITVICFQASPSSMYFRCNVRSKGSFLRPAFDQQSGCVIAFHSYPYLSLKEQSENAGLMYVYLKLSEERQAQQTAGNPLPAPCLLPRSLNRPQSISEGNTTHHSSRGVPSLRGINPDLRNPRAIPNRGTPHHSPCSSSGHKLPSQIWGALAWGRNGVHPTRTGSAGREQESCSPSNNRFLEESNSSP